jgi:hypothetical protein
MTRLSSFRRHLLILAVALPAALSCRATGPVTCSDGTTSKPGKDACSNHGGVQTAAASTSPKRDSAATPAKAAPAPAKAAPAPSAAQASTVACKDGSTSKAGSDACAQHGGVVKTSGTATPPAAPASGPTPEAALLGQSAPAAQPPTPARAPAGATAECKDGTYSMSKPSSTTCSKHGGVKKLLKQ